MMRLWYLVLGFYLVPQYLMAAVTINEIAWMGNSSSANYEWIELYNDSGAVSLDGWTLSDGENLSIALVGTIAGNSFGVLERTSDESAPGSAFLIYTGALKNTGATLSLYRADGGLEDRVSGGENWQNVGGDNATKETAQYTTSGWITASPTPGKVNAKEGSVSPSDSNEQASNSSARLAEPVKREATELVLGNNELLLQIIAPNQVFVNQSVDFQAEASGIGKTINNSLQYFWNFGDANVGSGKEPAHVFSYPGTYVVHLSASFGSKESEISREITVLPVNVSLTRNKAGDVQINNDSAYSIDLSGYRLRAHDVIELADNTKILSRQTITIPHTKVNSDYNTLVALYDTAGNMVSNLMPDRLKQVSTVVESEPVFSSPVRQENTNPDFQFVSTAKAAETETASATEPVNVDDDSFGIIEDNDAEPENWAFLALIALLLVSCVVVLMQPKKETNSLDKHE